MVTQTTKRRIALEAVLHTLIFVAAVCILQISDHKNNNPNT